MKIVIVSNFVNHHTRDLALELYARLGEGFAFVQTGSSRADAYRMGYAHHLAQPENSPWIICAMRNPERAKRSIWEADAVITANTSDHWILPRLRAGKLTFRAHERWYRRALPWYRWPRAVLGGWLHHGRFQNLYMLCASAYTARDANSVGCFRGKCYRWGYFPHFRAYEAHDLLRWQQNPEVNILCAGRMVDCKRFEDAIASCLRLRQEGFRFTLTLAGDGPELKKLQTLALPLGANAHFLGRLTPEQVRQQMEQSQIFLFTSDRREGWGVVLNEAMNSGCAVVASCAAGATPYLVEHGVSGLVYPSGDISALTDHLRHLLEHPEKRLAMGLRAYETIRDSWTPAIAAQRLCVLCSHLLTGEGSAFADGPCSPAPIVGDRG